MTTIAQNAKIIFNCQEDNVYQNARLAHFITGFNVNNAITVVLPVMEVKKINVNHVL